MINWLQVKRKRYTFNLTRLGFVLSRNERLGIGWLPVLREIRMERFFIPLKAKRYKDIRLLKFSYDDKIKMEIKNTSSYGVETTGALLIRNSWGTRWGDSGYGWLPYEYVLKGLAEDFRSILKKERVDTGVFKV